MFVAAPLLVWHLAKAGEQLDIEATAAPGGE
jgi:hypothetical protein